MATLPGAPPPSRTFARDLAKLLGKLSRQRYRSRLNSLRESLRPLVRQIRDEHSLAIFDGPAKAAAITLIEDWANQPLQGTVEEPLTELTERNARRAYNHAQNQVKAAGVQPVPPDGVSPALRLAAAIATLAAVAENNVLASRISQAGNMISKDVIAGRPLREMMRRAGALSNTMERTAQFRARDIAGDVTAEVTKTAFAQAGIKKAIWRTQGDNRVRPAHKALEGKVFDIAKGVPGVGNPGAPVNCRCYAEPVGPSVDVDIEI